MTHKRNHSALLLLLAGLAVVAAPASADFRIQCPTGNNGSYADNNGDGKVTREEAMAYEQSASTSTSATTTASTASTASSASSDAEIMKRIMDLVHAYGRSGSNTTTSFSQSA